jgi:hypothetical protein
MSNLQQDFTKLSQYDLHKFISAIGADDHKKLLINNLEIYGVGKKYKKDFIDQDDFDKTSADNLTVSDKRLLGGSVSLCKFNSCVILYGEQSFKDYINTVFHKGSLKEPKINEMLKDETLEIKTYYYIIGELICLDFGFYNRK